MKMEDQHNSRFRAKDDLDTEGPPPTTKWKKWPKFTSRFNLCISAVPGPGLAFYCN